MGEELLIKHLGILEKTIESYSESTLDKLLDILNSEQAISEVEQILKSNPTEEQFLKELKRMEATPEKT